jgi:tetratricopeptide (TPR) repeat protein
MKVIVLDTNNIDIYIFKGYNLSKLGKYSETIQEYDKAIALDENYTYALVNKGNAIYNRSQYGEAINYSDKALNITPDNLPIISNKGLTLVDHEDYDQAIDLAENYLDENPENKGLLCVVKNAYEKSNNLSLAGYYKEILLELDPNYGCELDQILRVEKEAFI